MPEPAILPAPPLLDAMVPRPFRIETVHTETADTVTLSMTPADDKPCPAFLPAQIGMIGIPGLGEVPVSYSGDPHDVSRLEMTIRAAGAITIALTRLGPGDQVTMRGAYGRPWPMPDRGSLVIIVGGLGLAPLRSAVIDARRRPDVDVRLVYGARSPHDLMFADDLAAWAADFDVMVVVEQPSDTWVGRVGLVTAALEEAFAGLDAPTVFMCGPDPMMAAVGPLLV
ncbi:MAG: hypothetical protein OEP52_11220, partial [Acidimicrobiia bacterium]|nr:hypothetical protein [Acidimicrobiia bacterium]